MQSVISEAVSNVSLAKRGFAVDLARCRQAATISQARARRAFAISSGKWRKTFRKQQLRIGECADALGVRDVQCEQYRQQAAAGRKDLKACASKLSKVKAVGDAMLEDLTIIVGRLEACEDR